MDSLERGAQEVHDAYGRRVEACRAIHKIALHEEIPEPGDENRHYQTGGGIVTVGLEADGVEPVPARESVI